jgi:HPt (histidine-containing phosphotransfer) domain-containing protein
MKGDRERCLSAGMDGYVSKPLDARELYDTINTFGGSGERLSLLDEPALLKGVAGDRKLLRELVQIFLADTPPRLDAIRAAVAGGDAGALAAAAHSIKSSVGVLSKGGVFEAARALETQGRESDLRGAGQSLARLESEMVRLTRSLESLASRLSPPSRARRVPKKSAKKKARRR